MKKFLLVLLVICGAIIANGQSTVSIPLAAGDTAVNTGTASKVIVITGSPSGIAIHAKLTKISGTVGGTLGVYGSGDGVTYDLIGSSVTPTDQTTNAKTFYITAPLPTYIKVQETGTGTMSAVLNVKYRVTKYQAL